MSIKDMMKENTDKNAQADTHDEKAVHDEYTFVRETIKEKPPKSIQILCRVSKVLGLGIVFGLGICLVLFMFNRDLWNVIVGNEKESGKEANQDNDAESDTLSEQESLNLEGRIKSNLADVIVIYYEKEQEGQTETLTSQETTELYQDEDVTPSISDDKEIKTTGKNNGSRSENDKTEAMETVTEDNEEETEKRKIAEKNHFTGVVVGKSSDVFICISYEKIYGADEVRVAWGKGASVKAAVEGTDLNNGLAVLRVKAKDIDGETFAGINQANVADIDSIGMGDKLVYSGNPYGKGRLIYTGTLAGVDGGHVNYDLFYRGIITDIDSDDIDDGFIFDGQGNLVAMVDVIDGEQAAGNNIAGVCMDDMWSVVKALMRGTKVKHIGIKADAVSDEMRELTGENMPDGVYVTEVARESSAYKSGIMVGDIITMADDEPVKNMRNIQKLLEKKRESDNITLVLQRKIGTNYSEIIIKVPVEASGGYAK